MFKATPPLQKTLRRLPLSPKQAGKEYYKGNRVGSMGTINRNGSFSPDWTKVRTFVYPNYATRTELTPFVAARIAKTQVDRNNSPQPYVKRFTGEDYLNEWKEAGGHDIVETDVAQSNRNMLVPFEEHPAAKS